VFQVVFVEVGAAPKALIFFKLIALRRGIKLPGLCQLEALFETRAIIPAGISLEYLIGKKEGHSRSASGQKDGGSQEKKGDFGQCHLAIPYLSP
jgi:hypothetical protein